MKTYELIDGGIYKVGDKVVKFDMWNRQLIGRDDICSLTRKKGEVLAVVYAGDDFPFDTISIPVEPLPLTAEILEKNGAILLNGFWLFEKNGFERAMLSYCDGNEGYMSDEAKEYFGRHWVFDENYRIDYVHELQHALRLCGLHKLADNFKV